MSDCLFTTRFQIYERSFTHQSPIGHMRCVLANAVLKDEPFPTLAVATVYLVELKGEWLLSHILIEDVARRNGVATEIISFYEERLGGLAACWASEEGRAFARKYVARFGPRPDWQIESDPEVERLIEKVLGPKPCAAGES